ncbi:hypothetical protein D3C71_1130330 [compost metagenome]
MALAALTGISPTMRQKLYKCESDPFLLFKRWRNWSPCVSLLNMSNGAPKLSVI